MSYGVPAFLITIVMGPLLSFRKAKIDKMPMLKHISEAVFFLVNTEYTLFPIKFLVFFEGLFHFFASTAGVFFGD